MSWTNKAAAGSLVYNDGTDMSLMARMKLDPVFLGTFKCQVWT